MTRPHSYQAQSRSVRGAARAHLRQLRAERLAKRTEGPAEGTGGTGGRPAPKSGDGTPAPALSVSRAATEALSGVPQIQPEPVPAPDTGPVASIVSEPSPELPPVESAPCADDPDLSRARPVQPAPEMGEAAEAVECAASEAPPDKAQADDPPAAPPEITAMEATDLDRLPGAGMGLLWMLNRCGIATLADLAAADPARLRTELGLVGDLLNLSDWIDFAREAATDATAPPPSRAD